MDPEIKSTSRSAEAYRLLRRDILNGALSPGSKLMIADLRERYGLGAMPLREALNRLSAEMLVDKHEQRGFSVPQIDLVSFLDLQNARIAIESVALRQSVEARLPGWEDALVLAFHHLRKAGPPAGSDSSDFLMTEAWSVAHGRFHRTLLEGCGNEWLLAFADKLYEQSSRYRMLRRHLTSLELPARATLIDEHRAIMDAALADDADAAVDLLVEHYRLSVRIVLGRPVRLSKPTLKLSLDDPASDEARRSA